MLVALLLLAGVLASCMGGDDAETDADASPQATAAGTAALLPPTAAPGEPTATVLLETPTPAPPTPSPTPVDTRVLALETAFVALEELPQGFYLRRDDSAGEADGNGADSERTAEGARAGICNVPLGGPQPDVSVARVWERTLNGPFVRQELLWLPDADDSPAAWLRERRLAARACDSWTEPDGSSSAVTILRRPTLASGTPADSLAVRVVTTNGSEHPIDLVTIILVVEHIVTITTLIDLGADVDLTLALQLAEMTFMRAGAIAADGQ